MRAGTPGVQPKPMAPPVREPTPLTPPVLRAGPSPVPPVHPGRGPAWSVLPDHAACGRSGKKAILTELETTDGETMGTLIVTEDQLRQCLALDTRSLAATEQAYSWIESGRVAMPPVMVITHPPLALKALA